MNQELQEKLYRKYPGIFRQKDLSMKETCMCWGLACGDGWYNIIDTLCAHLQYFVDEPNNQILLYTKWLNEAQKKEDNKKEIKRYQDYIEKESKHVIPQLEASQVKEKYGTLRFYLSGYPSNDKVHAKVSEAISFAESMSACICELCGNPGELNAPQGRWLSTRCNDCRLAEKENRQNFFNEARQLKIPFGDK